MSFKRKALLALSVVFALISGVDAFAGVLGDLTGGYRATMTDTTQFHKYKYNTNSTTQTEYFVEYKPDSMVVPVVVNGDSIYGKRTIQQAASYMKSKGLKPMIGINGDYFSFKTGVPMGHTIINGEIVTSDPSGQNAVGFNKDGTGFISWLEIQSKFVKADGSEMMLDCINKWCQPTISTSYLLTDKFAASTKTSGNCKFVIFSKVEGKLAIGDTIRLKVDEIFDYDGDILIPEGKYVLVMTNDYGNPQKLEFMKSLQIGEEISLISESVYDKDRWSKVDSGIGSIGGRLIENGKVNSNFEAGTAPRTAVGIKPDGTIVFYVIDGRQQNHSTGIAIKTLAKRMSELGCIDAINLDGGGSTAIAGVFPGSDEMSVLNKPSEGGLRSCANFIFLEDKRQSESFEYDIQFSSADERQYLSGYTENVSVSIKDKEGNIVDSSMAEYIVEQSSETISLNGNTVKMVGDGAAFLTAKVDNSQSHLFYRVYTTPHEIKAFSKDKQITKLTFKKGEDNITDIDAASYVYSTLINSYDGCYEYSCDKSIGYIDENGVFAPDTNEVKKGNIYIKAGAKTFTLLVEIISNSVFEDMSEHWAREDANMLYHKGITTGEEQDGKLMFMPDRKITRGEFAVMISRLLNLDVNSFADYNFEDISQIPTWQKPYANAVAAKGIIGGKQTDTGVIFASDHYLTRAEAMTIMYRSLDINNSYPDAEFKDSGMIPEYAKQPINALVGMGVVSGYEDGTIKPSGYVTRAESATIISRSIK